MTRRGLPKSNYTMVPNVLLDELLPQMSNSELRVVLALCRKIFGYHREQPEAISITQLESLTGLSRQGVINGLKEATARGIVLEAGETGKRGVKLYSLMVIEDDDQSTTLTSRKGGLVNELDQSQIELVNDVDQTKAPLVNELDQSTPRLVNDVDPQKKEDLKETKSSKKKNIRSSDPIARSDSATAATARPVDADDDTQVSPVQEDFSPSAFTPATLARELAGLGLSAAARDRLLQRDPVEALALVLHAKAAGRNPAGLLVTMLDRGDVPAAVHSLAAKRAFEYDDLLDDATQIAATRSAPVIKQAPVGLDLVAPSGLRIGDAWQALLGQLELQLNRATFDTWLRGCKAERYADGVLFVRAKHPYASEWLRNHLQQLMDTSLSDLAGAPVRVHVLNESEVAA